MNEEAIEDKIQYFERSIEKSKWRLDNQSLSQKGIRNTCSSLATHHRSLGLLHLSLGETATARERFSNAVEWELRSREESRTYQQDQAGRAAFITEPHRVRDALYDAVLGGDQDLTNDVVEIAQGLDGETWAGDLWNAAVYYHTQTVASIIADDGTARRHHGEFVSHAAYAEPEDRPLYHALASGLNGIIERDEATTTAGIRDVLDHHRETHDPENVVDRNVCREAAVLVALARQVGLDVRVDKRVHPRDRLRPGLTRDV